MLDRTIPLSLQIEHAEAAIAASDDNIRDLLGELKQSAIHAVKSRGKTWAIGAAVIVGTGLLLYVRRAAIMRRLRGWGGGADGPVRQVSGRSRSALDGLLRLARSQFGGVVTKALFSVGVPWLMGKRAAASAVADGTDQQPAPPPLTTTPRTLV